MIGYVVMSRDWQDHVIFEGEEYSRRDAWAWLIANAAWKPTKARVKGSTVELQRGELCFALRFLGEKWGWSKSKVDRFFGVLRAEGMISTRSKIGTTAGQGLGQGQTIITICNYDTFQSPRASLRDNDNAEIGTTAGQQRDKEETYNHLTSKKDNKRATRLSDDFEAPALWISWAMDKRNWSRSDAIEESEIFARYWQTKPGKDAAKLDWFKTWQNWVSNSRRANPASRFGYPAGHSGIPL